MVYSNLLAVFRALEAEEAIAVALQQLALRPPVGEDPNDVVPLEFELLPPSRLAPGAIEPNLASTPVIGDDEDREEYGRLIVAGDGRTVAYWTDAESESESERSDAE